MKIVIDDKIPYIKGALEPFAEIIYLPGNKTTAAVVKDADALITRTRTRCNRELLEGSKVKFIATATIGFDHIDLDYLKTKHIGFASAPGSNATSAAEYVISALLVMAERQGFNLQDKTVGIIGYGNVGSRVAKKLQALGVTCLINDPPLQTQRQDIEFVDLAELEQADIITVHVPLEKIGQHPTYQLINHDFLKKLRKEVIFINTSRGEVVDENALSHLLITRPEMSVILDVWENEPAINPLLLERVDIATPHIAGYSFDGKVRGTALLYQAVCRYFDLTPTWDMESSLPTPSLTDLYFSEQVTDKTAIHQAVMASYDVRRDDAALRLMSQQDNPREYFDKLRKHYPTRREFNYLTIHLPESQKSLFQQLQQLGFNIKIE